MPPLPRRRTTARETCFVRRTVRFIAYAATASLALAGLQVAVTAHQTDSAYSSISNAQTNATISLVPAYRMTCTTPKIDYGVTEEGIVYYGSGTSYTSISASGPLLGKKIERLVCNDTLMVGLDDLGDVYVWEIVPVSITKLPLPLDAGEQTVELTSTNVSFSVLTSTGRVFSFGQNNWSQFGNGTVDSNSSTRPTDRTPHELTFPTGLTGTKLQAIAGGKNGVVGLTTDGKAIQWGLTDSGPLNRFPWAVKATGALLNKTLVSVASSEQASLAVDSNGVLYSWGSGAALGVNNSGTVREPTAVNSYGTIANRPVAKLFSEWAGPIYALLQDGTLHTWGPIGAMGTNGTVRQTSAIPMATIMNGALKGKTILRVFPGSFTTSALVAEDEALYWWGFGWFINEANIGTPTTSLGKQQILPR
ncbi:hypothetical protein [Lysinibacter cavernae]|uniref:Alpha-tubulin suppressor-like RCC1 family protein n=1 Tax=Lysinibacter cavernae TaxID=1640652 RepID=A0A7X5TTQ7_9MICO|nr:hypothetical protein [Lysinibacter cavernae]NIH52882.1 alpha-tubulin suppressor-like RCC1 family protein [Lysinibacter cavernae]